jgi:hypothetical protein
MGQQRNKFWLPPYNNEDLEKNGRNILKHLPLDVLQTSINQSIN